MTSAPHGLSTWDGPCELSLCQVLQTRHGAQLQMENDMAEVSGDQLHLDVPETSQRVSYFSVMLTRFTENPITHQLGLRCVRPKAGWTKGGHLTHGSQSEAQG